MSDTNSAAKIVASGGLIYMIGLVFSYFTAYLYRLIIARWLGPGDYGLVSLALAIASLLSGLSGLGLLDGVYRYVSYYNAKNRPDRVKGVFYGALRINLVMAVLVAIGLFVFAGVVSNNIFHNPQLAPLLRLAAIVVPLILLMDSCLQIVRSYKKLKYEVYSRNFIENSVKLLTTILFLILGFQVMGALFGYVLSIICSTIATVYFMQCKVKKIFFSEVKAKYDYRELIKYSAPLTIASTISPVESWVDTIFVGALLSSTAVGIYNSALPTAQIAKLIFPALTALSIPIMTELLVKNKIAELKKIYQTISRWIFVLMLPITATFLIFAKQIIRVLFGEQYVSAALSLIILTCGYFVYAIIGPARLTLNVYGKTGFILINYIIAAGIGIIGNLYLIPRIGIVGAAISTAISFSSINILALIEMNWFIALRPISKTWIKPSIIMVICAGLLLVASRLYISLSSKIFFGIGIITLYFMLVFITSLESEDKFIISLVIKKVNKYSPILASKLTKLI